MFQDMIQNFTDPTDLLDFATRNYLENDPDVLARLDHLFLESNAKLEMEVNSFKNFRKLTAWAEENYLLHDTIIQNRIQELKHTCQICNGTYALPTYCPRGIF